MYSVAFYASQIICSTQIIYLYTCEKQATKKRKDKQSDGLIPNEQ